MSSTKIEFAHETLNPLIGCSRTSSGCVNCYALRMARRHEGNMKTPQYHGLTTYNEATGKIEWTGEVRWVPGVLENALVRLARSQSSKRIFHVSMGDLAHENATAQHLANILAFAAALPRHKHIIITKRPHILAERIHEVTGRGMAEGMWDTARRPLHDACLGKARGMRRDNGYTKAALAYEHKAEQIGVMLQYPKFPLPNVMLMATCEDQQRAEERIPHLLKLAAQGWHTGVIVEPMLGPVDLRAAYPEDFHYCTHCGWFGTETEQGCLMCDSGTPLVLDAEGRCQNGHDGYRTERCPKCGEDGRYFAFDSVREDTEMKLVGISWCVCGAEQGPGKRMMPMYLARDLAGQCDNAGMPFFFKKDSDGDSPNYPQVMPRQFPAWMEV